MNLPLTLTALAAGSVLTSLPALAAADLEAVEVFHLNTPEETTNVKVQGNTACLVNLAGGIVLVDISDPEAPVEKGSFPGTTGSFSGVAYDADPVGSLAYIAGGIAGLVIVDISDPTLPVEKGRLEFTFPRAGGGIGKDTALGVKVSGSHAFVSTVAHGVKVVDISNPALPVKVGEFQAATDPVRASYGVEITGTTAVVANHVDGVRLLDISNPAVPVLVGQYNTPGRSYRTAVKGSLVFVADGEGGLIILDISNPALPALVSTTPVPGSGAGHVYVDGSTAWVSTYEAGLIGVDVSNPAAPQIIARAYTEGEVVFFSPPGVEGSFVRDGMAFTAWGPDNLRVYNVSRPSALQKLSGYNTGTAVTGIACAGSQLFAAAGAPGVVVMDASRPDSPSVLTTLDTPGEAAALAISGSALLIADGSAGIFRADITQPAAPAAVSSVDTPGTAKGVAFWGTRALVADGSAGLQVVDFSNPNAPAVIGSLDTAGDSLAVAVSGHHAFIADGSGGLVVADLTNPAAPVRVATFTAMTPATGVLLWNSTTLCVAGAAGVQIVDITDPAAPLAAGVFESDVPVSGMAASGHYLFMAAGDRILVTDFIQPAPPVFFTLSTLAGASALCVSGDLVFAAEGSFDRAGPAESVAALRFFDPARPPRLENPLPSDGGLRLSFTASPRDTYRVRRSTDLVTWSDWLTVSGDRGPVTLTDTRSGPVRYYRLEAP